VTYFALRDPKGGEEEHTEDSREATQPRATAEGLHQLAREALEVAHERGLSEGLRAPMAQTGHCAPVEARYVVELYVQLHEAKCKEEEREKHQA
jgi:hypothetical protein